MHLPSWGRCPRCMLWMHRPRPRAKHHGPMHGATGQGDGLSATQGAVASAPSHPSEPATPTQDEASGARIRSLGPSPHKSGPPENQSQRRLLGPECATCSPCHLMRLRFVAGRISSAPARQALLHTCAASAPLKHVTEVADLFMAIHFTVCPGRSRPTSVRTPPLRCGRRVRKALGAKKH